MLYVFDHTMHVWLDLIFYKRRVSGVPVGLHCIVSHLVQTTTDCVCDVAAASVRRGADYCTTPSKIISTAEFQPSATPSGTYTPAGTTDTVELTFDNEREFKAATQWQPSTGYYKQLFPADVGCGSCSGANLNKVTCYWATGQCFAKDCGHLTDQPRCSE